MKKNYEKPLELVICDKCGYNNQPMNAKKYGTCLRCGHVIDPKAKYQYEMITRLRLWRNKKNNNYKEGASNVK